MLPLDGYHAAATDPDMTARARHVRLLDPAAGSGAFLLGALELLAALTQGADESGSSARRRVLRENLHGVDLNPTAVRLAELRLWLAVIADDTCDDPSAVGARSASIWPTGC